MAKTKVEQLFTQAFEKHQDEIFRYCYYRVFDRELGLELTQETFIKTWKVLAEGGEEIKNIRSYLYRVAKHCIIDHIRRRQTISLEELQDQGFEPRVNDDIAIKELVDVHAALEHIRKLEPIYREVLLLRFVNDLSPREIAEQIGETPNVVSVRINRGMKLLRVSWGE